MTRDATALAMATGGASTSCSMPSIAHPQRQPAVERLDMDVGRAGVDRVLDHLVDEADDRRAKRDVAQMLDRVALLLGSRAILPEGGLGALAGEALDGGLDVLGRGHERDDRLPEREAHRLEGRAVGGIGHGEQHASLALAERHDIVFAHEGARDAPRRGAKIEPLLLGDHRDAVMIGDGAGERTRLDQRKLSQRRIEPPAAFFLQARQFFHIRARQQPSVQQMLFEAGGLRYHEHGAVPSLGSPLHAPTVIPAKAGTQYSAAVRQETGPRISHCSA